MSHLAVNHPASCGMWIKQETQSGSLAHKTTHPTDVRRNLHVTAWTQRSQGGVKQSGCEHVTTFGPVIQGQAACRRFFCHSWTARGGKRKTPLFGCRRRFVPPGEPVRRSQYQKVTDLSGNHNERLRRPRTVWITNTVPIGSKSRLGSVSYPKASGRLD